MCTVWYQQHEEKRDKRKELHTALHKKCHDTDHRAYGNECKNYKMYQPLMREESNLILMLSDDTVPFLTVP